MESKLNEQVLKFNKTLVSGQVPKTDRSLTLVLSLLCLVHPNKEIRNNASNVFGVGCEFEVPGGNYESDNVLNTIPINNITFALKTFKLVRPELMDSYPETYKYLKSLV